MFSPPLDAKGNSVRGIKACERISRDFGLHLFSVARATSATVLRRSYDCTRIRSRRERSPAETALLAEQGGRVRVYELQGELVFGSVESVELAMLADVAEADALVVDLKRVVAVGDAAARLLLRLAERVAAAGSERRYPAGAVVLSIGDTAQSVFFVRAGEAEVWVSTGEGGKSGRRVRLTALGPGTVFGEIGILDREQRTANVTASTDLTCLEVPFAALDPAIREHMLANMARHFAAMLRENAELVRHLA